MADAAGAVDWLATRVWGAAELEGTVVVSSMGMMLVHLDVVEDDDEAEEGSAGREVVGGGLMVWVNVVSPGDLLVVGLPGWTVGIEFTVVVT